MGENALLSLVNVGSPVRHIGFFGPGYERLYASMKNEMVGCYHWDSGQKVCDVGGVGMGLRRALSDAVSSGGVTVIASSSPSFSSGIMTDNDFGDGDNAIDYLLHGPPSHRLLLCHHSCRRHRCRCHVHRPCTYWLEIPKAMDTYSRSMLIG